MTWLLDDLIDAAATVGASGLGAPASSCSYAAVTLARSPFPQGAGFTAARVFEITNRAENQESL